MNEFNAQIVKQQIIEWIRNYFEKNGDGCNAIIGVSGGKDSNVAAALCVEALGKDRVIAVLIPNSIDNLDFDAFTLINHLGIKRLYYDIEEIVKNIQMRSFKRLDTCYFDLSEQSKINLPPRIRMAILYLVAQSMNGRVVNTCNLSENWVGYSTRYGDSAGDFSPLADLLTDEVVEIGKACGLPDSLVEKIPADGLCGLSDEDNLGFSYKILNEYIRTGFCDDKDIQKKIDYLHKKNAFKLKPMPYFNYHPKQMYFLW